MNAKQKSKWVAALKALQTAAALPEMSGDQLRGWAIDTLARIAPSALPASDSDEISDMFVEHSRQGNFSRNPRSVLFRYMTDWSASPPTLDDIGQSGVLAQLGQAVSPYPLIDPPVLPVAYLSNPFSSPASYLAHPGIDVLDQETLTKIASRDTGA